MGVPRFIGAEWRVGTPEPRHSTPINAAQATGCCRSTIQRAPGPSHGVILQEHPAEDPSGRAVGEIWTHHGRHNRDRPNVVLRRQGPEPADPSSATAWLWGAVQEVGLDAPRGRMNAEPKIKAPPMASKAPPATMAICTHVPAMGESAVVPIVAPTTRNRPARARDVPSTTQRTVRLFIMRHDCMFSSVLVYSGMHSTKSSTSSTAPEVHRRRAFKAPQHSVLTVNDVLFGFAKLDPSTVYRRVNPSAVEDASSEARSTRKIVYTPPAATRAPSRGSRSAHWGDSVGG